MKLVRVLKNSNRKKNAAPAAPEEATTKTQTVSSAAKSAKTGGATSKTVTIEAKIDVGFGNALFLRGEGHGLSWNQGIPLTCVDSSTWKWSGKADDKLKFKLLLNDSVWSKGDDLIAAPGERLEISPSF